MADPANGPPLTPERVFREYAPRVYNLARRMLGNDADAEDVTQDVLLQVVRKLATFRGDAAFTTWLHRVTVNAALAARRKRARRDEGRVHDPLDGFTEDGQHTGHVRPWPKLPDDVALDREERQLIEQAITGLPEMYRDVFVLADVEQLPNAEIGELLDLSVPAVKSRLHRARLMMRDALSRHYAERAMTLTCRKVAELLIDFVESSLTEEQQSLLQRHLCGCVPCAIYMHTYRDTIRITHALPDEPLPAEFACRLKKVLEEAGGAGEAAAG